MKWINIKDKLPMDGEDVLCLFTGWDNLRFQRTLNYDIREKQWGDWNGVLHETVTHWMPLPEPPKL